ncbi:MAG: HmuY family protein [Saprospiraceae bacterium]|nr:HmuY family protein [Saprospiraceae bacterium]
MFKLNFLKSVLFISVIAFTFSCKKDEEPVKAVEATTSFLVDGSNAGNFTLFNFEKNTAISVSEQQSLNWDFGMRFTTFIVNSGVSGPGAAGVQLQNGIFDDIKEAPVDGYKTDISAADLAIKDGEWYDYNPVARTFAPKAGIVFIFKTANGKYVKMEMIKADPTDNNGVIVVPPTIPTKIKYTMRYVYQPNGTRDFTI